MKDCMTWKQKALVFAYFLVMMIILVLFSCGPIHVYDKAYAVDSYWVIKNGKYKYVYFLHNGRKAIYLHSNREYKVGKLFYFNQN
jgi:hypothetical protein